MIMATAKKAAKRPPATATAARSDATALLERDHAEVKKLFKRYEKLADTEADGAERQELAEQICAMLTVHATIEEEIFYPAAREAEVEDDLLDEAEVEHASAKDLIAQIRSMGPDDELYDAKVTVLGEYIDHHVQEEEGQMFPKCRRAKMDLAGLATALAERKSELMADAEATA
jgi:hemerythrin superfamily protein